MSDSRASPSLKTLVFGALLLLVFVGLVIPVFFARITSDSRPPNESRLRQLGAMLESYAQRHGRLPENLYQLGDYTRDMMNLQYETDGGGQADWVLVAAGLPERHVSDFMVIAAPQVSQSRTGQPERLVLYGDGTFRYLPEPLFVEQAANQAEDGRQPEALIPHLLPADDEQGFNGE